MDFQTWKVPALKEFLLLRGVPCSSASRAQLLELAEFAERIGLKPDPTVQQTATAISIERTKKLTLEGGLVTLPDPDSLKEGWELGCVSYPELTQGNVEAYFDLGNRAVGLKTRGREALRDGKSLNASQHVTNSKYHGISGGISYAFVQADVVRETSISAAPYSAWITVHKHNGTVETGYCSCPAGLRGTCKHVAALCHHIIEVIVQGKNKTVTSKKQEWGKRKKELHKPVFVEDITIQKIQGNCMVEEVVSKTKRFHYDPRALADRQEKSLEDLDLAGLSMATGGKAGILCFFPEITHQRPQPDVSDAAVVHEEEVEDTGLPLPPTLAEIVSITPADSFLEAALQGLSVEQVEALESATRDQGDSVLWHAHRQGRLTASRILSCTNKVTNDGNIRGKTTSYIKTIMLYYPHATTTAMHWGLDNEKTAVAKFQKYERRRHKKLSVASCGLFVCRNHPLIAASPDMMVTCECCGRRPLEVKNPYKYRTMTIQDLAQQKDSCLLETPVGIKLDRTHAYYAQVQVQMLATEADVGYFCMSTVASSCNYHFEQIPFDSAFVEDLIFKAGVFFTKEIAPELLTGRIKAQMEEEKNHEQPEQESEQMDVHVDVPYIQPDMAEQITDGPTQEPGTQELPGVQSVSVNDLFNKPARNDFCHKRLLPLWKRNCKTGHASETDSEKGTPVWTVPDLRLETSGESGGQDSPIALPMGDITLSPVMDVDVQHIAEPQTADSLVAKPDSQMDTHVQQSEGTGVLLESEHVELDFVTQSGTSRVGRRRRLNRKYLD